MTRSTVENGENTNQFAAFVGLDWADEKHDVCLSVGNSMQVEYAVIQQTPEAIDDWACRMRERFGGRPVAVCIEQTRGAVVYALMKYEFITIFSLPPARLAKYRESFTSSGAKDDPSDANLIWDYLTRHPGRLTAWKPDDPLTREIGLLAEARRDAVNLRTQLANQLIATLKGYFPQALSLLGQSVHAPMACDFLSKWTTSDQLAKARPQTVREFYYAHNCRSERLIQERLQTIAGLLALTTDTAIVNSSVMKVRMLVRQLRPITRSIEEYDQQLKQLLAQHPDAQLYTCLPGAGDVLAPRLLAALGTDRDRFASASAVQCLSGIAPVTKRSGKRCSVQRRWACAKFLRQSFHEFAHHSRHQSPWAKAFYQSQRAKGKSHHTAVRALAFKWLRILYRCWKTKTPYNETVYLDALERRNSPLLQYLDQPLAPCA